jgi:hypothetical protein
MAETIKDTAKFYKENKYCVIKNFIPKSLAEYLYVYAQLRAKRARTMVDRKWPKFNESSDGGFTQPQCPGVYSCYGDPAMEALLLRRLDEMKKITGLNLIPTYAYWRLYKTGDVLKRHKDRPSCEVSTTLFLGHNIQNLKNRKKDWENYKWPMWVDKTGGFGNKGVPLYLEPGDMILYRGCEIEHWREPFLGENHAQVFLHYNNLNGPYGENMLFDGRPHLGLPPDFRDKEKLKKMKEEEKKLQQERAPARKNPFSYY